MAARRDYVNEIVLRRNRLLRRTNRWDQVTERLRPLLDSLEELKDTKRVDKAARKELIKYIPVGGVACVEGWYRMAVAELIDRGSPFRENATSLDEIRFDPSSVLAIHDRKLSLGEFFAHFLPAKRFDDLNRTLSVVSGEDFLERFKFTRINPETKPNPVTFGKEAPVIFEGVKRTFELRHIFCHELATSFRFSVGEIEACAHAVLFFLIGADRTVQDLIDNKAHPAPQKGTSEGSS
jgi:hypothetical protein